MSVVLSPLIPHKPLINKFNQFTLTPQKQATECTEYLIRNFGLLWKETVLIFPMKASILSQYETLTECAFSLFEQLKKCFSILRITETIPFIQTLLKNQTYFQWQNPTQIVEMTVLRAFFAHWMPKQLLDSLDIQDTSSLGIKLKTCVESYNTNILKMTAPLYSLLNSAPFTYTVDCDQFEQFLDIRVAYYFEGKPVSFRQAILEWSQTNL